MYMQTFDASANGIQMPVQRQQQQHQSQQFDFSVPLQMHSHQQMSQQMSQQSQHNAPKQDHDVDDSGICMGLMDDDLNLAKFGLNGAHVGHDYVGGGDMGIHAI